jgi:hypothetical protein
VPPTVYPDMPQLYRPSRSLWSRGIRSPGRRSAPKGDYAPHYAVSVDVDALELRDSRTSTKKGRRSTDLSVPVMAGGVVRVVVLLAYLLRALQSNDSSSKRVSGWASSPQQASPQRALQRQADPGAHDHRLDG